MARHGRKRQGRVGQGLRRAGRAGQGRALIGQDRAGQGRAGQVLRRVLDATQHSQWGELQCQMNYLLGGFLPGVKTLE